MRLVALTDFTDTARGSLKYSIDLLKQAGGGELHLVHVISSRASTDGLDEQFDSFIKAVRRPKEVDIQQVILKGDLFDAIGEYASSNNFDMMVFATHGAKGMQKLLGSYAAKVIQKSACPVIVVQDKMKMSKEGIKRIALPLTLQVENRKILEYTTDFARKFGAAIEIIYQKHSDEVMAALVKKNLYTTTSHYRKNNVTYYQNAIHESEGFDQAVIDMARGKKCDLIAVVNHREDGYRNLFGWNFDQNMIENDANIPLLTFDPKQSADVRR